MKRGLALALPEELSEREARLLRLAEESAQTVGQSHVDDALREHALGYLALACLSWARNARTRASADAALIAAIALAVAMPPNHRQLMCVSHELRDLASLRALDVQAREIADVVGAERALEVETLCAKLAPVLGRIEGEAGTSGKHQTASPECSQIPNRRRSG